MQFIQYSLKICIETELKVICTIIVKFIMITNKQRLGIICEFGKIRVVILLTAFPLFVFAGSQVVYDNVLARRRVPYQATPREQNDKRHQIAARSAFTPQCLPGNMV
jgi:hypothetical protein